MPQLCEAAEMHGGACQNRGTIHDVDVNLQDAAADHFYVG